MDYVLAEHRCQMPFADAAITYPSRASSPWIRLWPHLGFSRAIRTISVLIDALVDGRPWPAPVGEDPLAGDQVTVPTQDRGRGDRKTSARRRFTSRDFERDTIRRRPIVTGLISEYHRAA
jgi:hypothetical protein